MGWKIYWSLWWAQIHSKRKFSNGTHTLTDRTQNEKIISDRVLFQNLFGFVCPWILLWKRRCNRNSSTHFFTIFTLTNLRIVCSSFRARNSIFCTVINLCSIVGRPTLSKRPASQLHYCEIIKLYLNSLAVCVIFSDFSANDIICDLVEANSDTRVQFIQQ